MYTQEYNKYFTVYMCLFPGGWFSGPACVCVFSRKFCTSEVLLGKLSVKHLESVKLRAVALFSVGLTCFSVGSSLIGHCCFLVRTQCNSWELQNTDSQFSLFTGILF